MVNQAVDRALTKRLAQADVETLLAESIERRLADLDFDSLLLEKLEQYFESGEWSEAIKDRIQTSGVLAADGIDDKLDELARGAVQKVFDGEGASNHVERALTKIMGGRSPEEVVSGKLGKLFERVRGEVDRPVKDSADRF